MTKINAIEQRWSSMSDKPNLISTSTGSGWRGFEFQEIEVPIEGTFEGQSSAVHLYSHCGPIKLRFSGKKTFTYHKAHQDLVLPNETKCGAWTGVQRGLHFFIDQEAVECISHRPFSNNNFSRSMAENETVRNIIYAFRIDTMNRHPNGPVLGETIAAALIHHLLTGTDPPSSTPEHKGISSKEVEKLRELIEANLARPISLEHLAKEINVSVRHLCRTFQAATGQSPYRYILSRRVERAKQLIETGQLSLMEVAASAGFAHQSHMADTFKKLIGFKPSQFMGRSKNTIR